MVYSRPQELPAGKSNTAVMYSQLAFYTNLIARGKQKERWSVALGATAPPYNGCSENSSSLPTFCGPWGVLGPWWLIQYAICTYVAT